MTFSSQKPHVLMTGGDPRLHPEFICLQNEIKKLSHPARPDINWLQVMESCTRLFGQAGADLQSVCWFTLALSHLDGGAQGHGGTDVLTLADALAPPACRPDSDPENALSASAVSVTHLAGGEA